MHQSLKSKPATNQKWGESPIFTHTPMLNKITPQQKLIFQISAVLAGSMVFAPVALLIPALLYSNWEHVRKEFEHTDPERSSWPWIAIAFMMAAWLSSGNLPMDDAWRHMSAWQHGYDYRKIYFEISSDFPAYSQWIGYEWLTGQLSRAVGLDSAIRIVQGGNFVVFIWLLYRAVVRMPIQNKQLTFLILLMLLATSGAGLRLVLARPEGWWLLLVLAAYSLPWWLWALFAMAMQPLYWLAPIYAPAAFLLRTSWDRQWLTAILVASVGLAFWLWFSHWDWLRTFDQMREWLSHRQINVGENRSMLIAFMFAPASMLLLAMATMRVMRDGWMLWLPSIAVLAWFCIPNQIRYLATVSVILAMMAAPMLAQYLQNAGVMRLPLVVASMFLALNATNGLMPGSALPSFKSLRPGDRVLTEFDAATYLLPARTPGVIVAPAMELGASSQRFQTVLKELGEQGRFNCEKAADIPYTHLAEQHLQTIPSCLELQEISGKWRLWKRKVGQ